MNHNPNPVHTFVFVSVSSSLPVMCPVTCTQRAELKSLDEHHRLLPNCARVFTGVTEKHMCVCVRACALFCCPCALSPVSIQWRCAHCFVSELLKMSAQTKTDWRHILQRALNKKKKKKTIWPPSRTFPAPVGSLEPHWHFCMTQNRPMFSKTVVHHQQMIKY